MPMVELCKKLKPIYNSCPVGFLTIVSWKVDFSLYHFLQMFVVYDRYKNGIEIIIINEHVKDAQMQIISWLDYYIETEHYQILRV